MTRLRKAFHLLVVFGSVAFLGLIGYNLLSLLLLNGIGDFFVTHTVEGDVVGINQQKRQTLRLDYTFSDGNRTYSGHTFVGTTTALGNDLASPETRAPIRVVYNAALPRFNYVEGDDPFRELWGSTILLALLLGVALVLYRFTNVEEKLDRYRRLFR